MTIVNVPERVSGIVTDDSMPLRGCENTTTPSSVSNSMPLNEYWLPQENLCPSICKVTGGAKEEVLFFSYFTVVSTFSVDTVNSTSSLTA